MKSKLTAARSSNVSNHNLVNNVVEHEIRPFIDFATCSVKSCIDEILNIHHQTELYCEHIELLTNKVSSGLNIKVLADVFESILDADFADTNDFRKDSFYYLSIHVNIEESDTVYLEPNSLHPVSLKVVDEYTTGSSFPSYYSLNF
ncbi:Endoribonuclease Dicer 4 [Schistosoma japonicum]|nr:Endoribonuclease Dicer 4 [Schistosoma japonicum]